MAGGVPGYWMNETSGVLAPAVEAYLTREEMSAEQIAAMRAYLRQWIMVGQWAPTEGVMALRMMVDGISSKRDIDRWLMLAEDEGIDPL